ncbi:inhibitor of nuclear factor kappa-B kinase subunit alpha [Leucoraja erinacea]|uniref:inhibitor of nuclear factor kappa-B kinase subunit alpha n=1 Tax=Leucoraja erinaceus TaxID=7782 RepID=UPI002458220B|nr:inhibitor of nuclear factor kappa-B kinase subunit alpha [Leucoraja erinacea]XP_055517678.1 inhibitor of nuclear factor kappa-B kinase subunit alpha [Leucoraja erinacea]
MEKPPFRQVPTSGPWDLKERLGAGGFGHVYMYEHKSTGERIAVKACRVELSARNKERWCHEIQIMKKLNNANVVKAREVPEEMQGVAFNDVPLLAMEFCTGGNLRKVLGKPENCCGLKESQVLSLLHDVGSGIQYLHNHRIIHRDLKPENIVLQEDNGKLIYKIIDLGYAKDLDQGSLCTSFVGTLQYLAPELFESQSYTVTVDYWSFGTLVFECISGFRPFLHNMQPFQSQDKVRVKGQYDIMAVEEMNGEVRFSPNLPQPNGLSTLMVKPLETWLQMMLVWDPKQRGGNVDPNTNRLACFTLLEQILSQKFVHILNMTSARVHSFLIEPDESLHSLQMRIEAETEIAAANQELLVETGISLDPRKPANQCVPDVRGWDRYMVYLFDKSSTIYEGPFVARKLPEHVNYVVRDAKIMLPNAQLRKVWGEAVNYVCGLKEDYSRLFQGQRAAMLSLLRYNNNLTKMKTTMFSNSQQLKARLDFFQSSIKLDLEKYSEQMAYGISSEKMLKAWKEMEEKAEACKQAAEIGHLEEQIMGLHSEIVELQRSPYARRQGDVMENLEQKAIDLYRKLKGKPKDSHQYGDSTEMVKIIVQTVQNQDRVLKELYTHLSKLLACKQKIIDLFPKIEQALDNIRENEKMLLRSQEKRQKEIWYLLKIACSTARGPESASLESSGSPHGLGWAQQAQTLTPQNTLPNPLSSISLLKNSESSMTVIEENQSFCSQLHSLMQETLSDQKYSMSSLDWSWLEEMVSDRP